MISPPDHDVVSAAAIASRYRQRRLILLVALLAVTVVPIVAVGAWWLWPLLVIPAALAAPLAGGVGLVGTLLATTIALAAASGGHVTSAEIVVGFVALVAVAVMGAAHAAVAEGVGFARHGMDAHAATPPRAGGLAPVAVFDLVAHRDCRRAAEDGAAVSLALVTIPRLDAIAIEHGHAISRALLHAANHGVARVISPSDLVVDMEDGRFMALVSGPAARAREAAERIAVALESLHVRAPGGSRVTSGAVAIGVAQWADGDVGVDGMVSRAESSLELDARVLPAITDGQITSEFRSVAVADAA